jgi:hypothetical protein
MPDMTESLWSDLEPPETKERVLKPPKDRIKTMEEESQEYLQSLGQSRQVITVPFTDVKLCMKEAKLARLQANGRVPKSSEPPKPDAVDLASDDEDETEEEEEVEPTANGRDEEGLHLLYEPPQPPVSDHLGEVPPHASSSTEPAPSPAPNALRLNITQTVPNQNPTVLVVEPAPSEPAESPTRSRIVRFRSRVRITSGIHQRNESASTSTSASESSSMSAPLRSPTEEHVRPQPNSSFLNGNHAASLSALLSADAASAWLRGKGNQSSQSKGSGGLRGRRTTMLPSAATEHSPLITASDIRRDYLATHPNGDDEVDEEMRKRAAMKSQEDVVFGTWPGRLLNRHVSRPLCPSIVQGPDILDVLLSGGGGRSSQYSVSVAETMMISKIRETRIFRRSPLTFRPFVIPCFIYPVHTPQIVVPTSLCICNTIAYLHTSHV